MFKMISLICIIAMIPSFKGQEYDEMTHDEIISESQICGESNFFESECMEKSNCVFLHWNKPLDGDTLRLCMSYNEIMKYYVKNPVDYLKKQGAMNHKMITKSNFCDVIDDDNNFLEERGEIKHCLISTI